MLKNIESKIKKSGRKIDHMTNEEIKRKVTYYFNKYGRFDAGSPEYGKLVKGIKKLGFSSLHEAGRYKKSKSKKR